MLFSNYPIILHVHQLLTGVMQQDFWIKLAAAFLTHQLVIDVAMRWSKGRLVILASPDSIGLNQFGSIIYNHLVLKSKWNQDFF